jgi:hypothetical protein
LPIVISAFPKGRLWMSSSKYLSSVFFGVHRENQVEAAKDRSVSEEVVPSSSLEAVGPSCPLEVVDP